MISNLYSMLARDVSGMGVLGIAFAGVLGMLLIWDARGTRETVRERER